MDTTRAITKMQACEEIIGYTFKDKSRLWEALQMAGNGVTRAGRRRLSDGNKEIAIVGDRVLELVLSEEWHERGEPRYQWSRIQQKLCSNASLARVGNAHRLQGCINVFQGPVSPYMMATTVEAIVGAAYRDNGLVAARTVMNSLGLFGHDANMLAKSSLSQVNGRPKTQPNQSSAHI